MGSRFPSWPEAILAVGVIFALRSWQEPTTTSTGGWLALIIHIPSHLTLQRPRREYNPGNHVCRGACARPLQPCKQRSAWAWAGTRCGCASGTRRKTPLIPYWTFFFLCYHFLHLSLLGRCRTPAGLEISNCFSGLANSHLRDCHQHVQVGFYLQNVFCTKIFIRLQSNAPCNVRRPPPSIIWPL